MSHGKHVTFHLNLILTFRYLQFATEFAKFAAADQKLDNLMKHSRTKPFQSLIFLVRDWVCSIYV